MDEGEIIVTIIASVVLFISCCIAISKYQEERFNRQADIRVQPDFTVSRGSLDSDEVNALLEEAIPTIEVELT